MTQQSEDKDEKYRKEIHINADQDIDAYGYTFSVADVDALDYYIEQTGELKDAGFDLEMAAVTIGCRRFEIEELRGLIRAYRDMKREEHEQREQIFVTCGDRLAKKCPGGGLSSQYMVAQIGYDDYILVSTTSGNRWNSVVVRGAEDYRRMSLRSFLTDSDAPSDWSKIS